MLSINNPEILEVLEDFHGGMLPFVMGEQKYLVFKIPKECILTVKKNKKLEILLDKINLNDKVIPVLLAIFHDDEDEPLILKNPLFDQDLNVYQEFFRAEKIQISFFNENNYELMYYEAMLENIGLFIEQLRSMKCVNVESVNQYEFMKAYCDWEIVDKINYESKILITLLEPLFPDDFLITDLRGVNYDGIDNHSIYYTQLIRDENPGKFQELEIAKMLSRIFKPDQIFINPLKIEDGKEIADIIVVTENELFLIQAKDTPNTEEILSSSLKRKKSKTLKHFKKAVEQYKGAARYINQIKDLEFKIAEHIYKFPEIQQKKLRSIIIVKELFLHDYSEYSKIMLQAMQQENSPCLFWDFTDLQEKTMVLRDNLLEFNNFYDRTYERARHDQEFLKVVLANRIN
ncbi:hypothetical protein [Acinetobacter sp. BSP-28]|uniref:hypothetical protein n=1 Tax=Acinetobacter sp. BSP-28 TaxID=3344661 RepID=UPI00376FA80C